MCIKLNMKTFLCVCIVIVLGGLDTIQFSPFFKDKVHRLTLECITETGVKPELVAEAKKGRFIEDNALKKFILCFFQKINIINEEAIVDIEMALSKVPLGVDKADVKKVLEECKNKSGKDAADTAYEIFKCFKTKHQHLLVIADDDEDL